MTTKWQEVHGVTMGDIHWKMLQVGAWDECQYRRVSGRGPSDPVSST